MVLAWVPRGTASVASGPIDWPGIVLLAGGLVGVLLAVSQGGAWGWTSPLTIGVGAAGIVLLIALVLVELRSVAPVVDVRTFRHGPDRAPQPADRRRRLRPLRLLHRPAAAHAGAGRARGTATA